MDPAHDPDGEYERFLLIANGPALFNAVVAGLDLGVFTHLSQRPHATFDELRRFAGIQPHKMRVLLLTLCSCRLVVKQDGRYSNSPLAARLLASDSPDSWRHIFLSRHRTDYAPLAYTTSALRTGTNTGLAVHPGDATSLYGRVAEDEELEFTLHGSITAFTLQAIGGLLGAPELPSVRRLLDVGGGAGTTATQIALRYADIKVTIFDLPSVAKLAQESVPDTVADRITFSAGNMFDDPFPPGADAVLFSHVLDVFAPEQIELLLAKAMRTLGTGGRILIYSFNAGPDEDGGILAAQLSLYLNVLATGDGMAYPARDYEDWLRQAGCHRVRTYSGLPLEHGLVVGEKR